jgi:ornithine cyclodeaminase/alanine dehydrogenase-like protein (mu-crystallin family)
MDSSTLIISDQDVSELFSADDALEAVEEAFRQYGLGLAAGDGMTPGFVPPPKRELRIRGKGLPHGAKETIAIGQGIAALEGAKMAVIQHSFKFRDRRTSTYHLIDTDTGRTLAIILDNDRRISLMRTSADAAVAAKYLSRKDSKIAGIVGTGRQGQAQLRYLMKVRPIERVYAHSGRRKDESYAREMAAELGIEVVASDSVREVVERSDIIALNTRATSPIVQGSWLRPGAHVNGIGADCPLKAELDAASMARADKIVIDCDQVLDAGDLKPVLDGRPDRGARIYGTIGEVVAGVKPARERDSEITIYKSTGTTMPYVIIGARIYEKARRLGRGITGPSVL